MADNVANHLLTFVERADSPVRPDLLELIATVKDYARPILAAVGKAAEDAPGVFHEPWSHAEEIAALCGRLLPAHRLGNGPESINVVEAALLVAASYLHQVGLNDPSATIKTYSVLSARQVWDDAIHFSRVGLDPVPAALLARLCSAHRDQQGGREVKPTLHPDQKDGYWLGHKIQLAVLGAILRTANLLEVLYQRRVEDLGAGVPPEEQQAWVDDGPVAAIEIGADRGIIQVRLEQPLDSSGVHRNAAQRWVKAVNGQFASRVFPILAEFKLAYREDLVHLPSTEQAESSASAAERAMEQFRRDAQRVIACRHELGAWDLRNSGDGLPFIQRVLIDQDGQPVQVQILPSIRYPSEAPTAKTNPRIRQLQFREMGRYVGPAIRDWRDLVAHGEPLVQLCEELRRFESPAQVFALHAREAVRQNSQWRLHGGDVPAACEARRQVTRDGRPFDVVVSPSASYPLSHPKVDRAAGKESQPAPPMWTNADIAGEWRRLLESDGAPLTAFLRWLDARLPIKRTGEPETVS